MEKNAFSQVLIGFLACLVTGLFVLGSLNVSQDEDVHGAAASPPVKDAGADVTTPEPALVSEITLLPSVTPPQMTQTPFFAKMTSPSALPAHRSAATATAVHYCQPPGGWYAITVNTGDTLTLLAERHGVTKDILMKENCLSGETLEQDTLLYVPGATVTPTGPAACKAPASWVQYSIQAGDTLSQLAAATNVSVSQIQSANCLGDASVIRIGQMLALPFLPPLRSPTAIWYSPTPPIYLSSTPQFPATNTPGFPATAEPTQAPQETVNAPWPSTTPE